MSAPPLETGSSPEVACRAAIIQHDYQDITIRVTVQRWRQLLRYIHVMEELFDLCNGQLFAMLNTIICIALSSLKRIHNTRISKTLGAITDVNLAILGYLI